MNFDKFQTEAIEIEFSGNTAYANIQGLISPAYFVQQVRVIPNEYCSEVLIYVDKDRTPGKKFKRVLQGYKKQIKLGIFNAGQFCVRVNRKNDVVTWFKVKN